MILKDGIAAPFQLLAQSFPALQSLLSVDSIFSSVVFETFVCATSDRKRAADALCGEYGYNCASAALKCTLSVDESAEELNVLTTHGEGDSQGLPGIGDSCTRLQDLCANGLRRVFKLQNEHFAALFPLLAAVVPSDFLDEIEIER